MAIPGEAFENPVTGERMVFDKTGSDTNGALLKIEFLIQPNRGKGLAAHFHPYFDELFNSICPLRRLSCVAYELQYDLRVGAAK